MNLETKVDLILKEFQELNKKLELNTQKISDIETNNNAEHKMFFEQLTKLENDNAAEHKMFFEQLTKLENDNAAEHKMLFEQLTKLENDNASEHKMFFERLAALEANNAAEHKKILNQITIIDANNHENYQHVYEMLESLNSAFIRYESEELDKVKILFDSDKDRKDQQKIFAFELNNLNNQVTQNSFRISNLEQHFK